MTLVVINISKIMDTTLAVAQISNGKLVKMTSAEENEKIKKHLVRDLMLEI